MMITGRIGDMQGSDRRSDVLPVFQMNASAPGHAKNFPYDLCNIEVSGSGAP